MLKPPPTFATFTGVAVELGKQAANGVDTAHRQLENVKAQLERDMFELEQRTNHFIEHGWADLRQWYHMPIRPHYGGYGHSCWSWEQYFRKLARDMHRPFINVRAYYSATPDQPAVVLRIPKRKSLYPLSSSFFLFDASKHRHDTVSWCWLLTAEQFAWWCAAIHTDPDMSRVLK